MSSEWIEKSARLPTKSPHKIVKIWRGSPEKGMEAGRASALDVARDPKIEAWKELPIGEPLVLSAEASASRLFDWTKTVFSLPDGIDRITLKYRRRDSGENQDFYKISGIRFYRGISKIRWSWRCWLQAMRIRYAHGYGFGSQLAIEGWDAKPPIYNDELYLFIARSGELAILELHHLHPIYRCERSAHQDLAWAAAFVL